MQYKDGCDRAIEDVTKSYNKTITEKRLEAFDNVSADDSKLNLIKCGVLNEDGTVSDGFQKTKC